MKITLAFLLLGTCIAFTNARSVPKKTAHEAESLSHVRMLALSYNRWREYQECNRCSSIEKSCKLRAIMSDCFIILNLMANDLGVEKKKLLSVKVNVKITVLIDALEKNDYESYANHVEKTGSINSFMEMMTIVVKGSTDEAGLDLGGVLSDCLGDALGGILKIFPDILGGLLGSVTGIIGGVVDVVGGLTGSLGDITGSLGGLTGGLGGLTGGLGGLTGGLGGLTGGKKGVKG
ncbi:uncharacterized protein LOC120932238 isoform X2 [Rana temporaria]|uniref:uncharacterized protein LOC120932238 isoform X2 n=1 Tax=Rana temporaria TaxID=8407 RepID=UPI001AACF507|nr:uncharacterized protein LOC120932238 isoform X2 [Rana temporaria]